MRASAPLGIAVGLAGLVSLPFVPGCGAGVPLYPSRADYRLLTAKLTQSGHRVGEAVTLLFAAMVDNIQPRRAYKFVVTADGRLVIAPLPADVPGNPWHHPHLARGRAVRTAGMLTLAIAPFAEPGTPRPPPRRLVVLDQRSGAYCPSFASLRYARDALVRIGLAPEEIRLADRPPHCLRP